MEWRKKMVKAIPRSLNVHSPDSVNTVPRLTKNAIYSVLPRLIYSLSNYLQGWHGDIASEQGSNQ